MEKQGELLQRWRDLRQMLSRQLKMFENGTLSLHSNDMDVAPIRVEELKAQILHFDALIAGRSTLPVTQ